MATDSTILAWRIPEMGAAIYGGRTESDTIEAT